jgi:S-DNA-T family DNA segregation ATPase FtsK/SpoIIIE
VIKDNLRANTNLRVALRVADEADSTDVLGSAEAAWFDQGLPGRAVSKTGPGRLVPFQTAYVGGHTVAGAQAPDIQVQVLGIAQDTVWALPEAITRWDGPTGPTDIARVVDTIERATAAAGMQRPRKPWLPDLGMLYDLADPAQVRSERRDDLLVFGVQDDPDRQRQVPVGFSPDQHGNLAVFGTGGAGKSTLLRTLTATAAVVARGGPCHVYGLDFGSSGLSMLRDLPHVGAVISGGDEERVQRLVRWLRGLVTERATRYAAVGAGTVTEYRRLSGQDDEARILLLVDGLAAFRSAFESAANQVVWDMLLAVAAEGRPVGVHLIVTADRPGALPTALGSSIQQRVVLRMADPADYATLGVPADILAPASPPGRAIVDEREVQVALLGRAGDTKSQADALAELARAMQNARVRPAPPVRRLPESLPVDLLPGNVNGLPVLGLSGTDLEPATFEPKGSFVVTGPPVSGRSTALHAVAVALRRWDPRWQLVLLGADRRSELARLPSWTRVALGVTDVAQLARILADQLTEQYDRPGAAAAQVAVVLEGFPELAGAPDPALGDLVKAVLAADGLLVAEGEVSQMQPSHGVFGAVKAGRTGIALQPDPADGFAVFKTQFPNRLRPQDFPVGRGLLAHRGTVTTVQVMHPGRGTRDPHDRLEPADLLVPAAYEPSSHLTNS